MTAENVTWITSGGENVDLSSDPYEVLIGRQGIFMPNYQFYETQVPDQPGSRLTNVLAQPREMDLPLMVRGATRSAYLANVRSLATKIHTGNGDGMLKVTSADGTVRTLTCRYKRGLEMTGQPDYEALTWNRVILTFRAMDPFWYAISPVVDTWSLSTSTGYFLPMPPLRVTSSAIFADVTVANDGDVESWPVWTINGPGSLIVIENFDTFKKIDLPVSLSLGESIAIDTRPNIKTVVKNDGTNLFPSLTSDSSLWPLQRGNNGVRVTMNGANASSSVVLSFYPRFLSI